MAGEDDDALEGDLGSVSNEEWLAAHKALIESEDLPPDEVAYLYDPDRDPDTVTRADLTPTPDPKEPKDG